MNTLYAVVVGMMTASLLILFGFGLAQTARGKCYALEDYTNAFTSSLELPIEKEEKKGR